MRLLCLFCSLALGCSDRANEASPGRSQGPAETVGIVLQGNGPRLQVGVTFFGGVAPEPHVQPIAAVLAKAREACFSGPVTGTVSVRAKVHDGKIHVVSPGPKDDCLAKALDGAAIEDPAKLEILVQVSPSP